MKYSQAIRESQLNARRLELLYQEAERDNTVSEFSDDLRACFAETPDVLLYQAWFYRLGKRVEEPIKKPAPIRNWKLAIPLAILNGLLFWSLSSDDFILPNHFPTLFLIWAPIATIFALGYLAYTAQQGYRRALQLGGGLVIASTYVLLIKNIQQTPFQNDYLNLMAIHLPLLAWASLGIYVLGLASSIENRFAFFIKSLEVAITAGLYLIAGMAFGGITMGLFSALNFNFPELLSRLVMAGGFGLLPILAVASVYDPSISPALQDFSQGLSKLIATLMRLLVPLTLVVLAAYVLVIPFNFMEPFKNREALIVYNVLLFAIMGLLIGATPIAADELQPRLNAWLRYSLLAVAVLTVLVSLYALSATAYRTFQGGITINRLTIMGWNTINIALLIWAILRILRGKAEQWTERLKTVFGLGANAYIVWTLFLILLIPLMFR